MRVVLITGRRYPAARRVAAQLGRGVPLVLHHGALVVEPEPERDHDGTPQVLRCLPLDRGGRASPPSASAASAAPIPSRTAASAARAAWSWPAIAADNEMLLGYVDRGRRDRVQVEDLERDLPDDVVQVMFAGRLPADARALPAARRAAWARARRWSARSIRRTGWASSTCCIRRSERARPSPSCASAGRSRREETLAIGDNWNDRDMLTGGRAAAS